MTNDTTEWQLAQLGNLPAQGSQSQQKDLLGDVGKIPLTQLNEHAPVVPHLMFSADPDLGDPRGLDKEVGKGPAVIWPFGVWMMGEIKDRPRVRQAVVSWIVEVLDVESSQEMPAGGEVDSEGEEDCAEEAYLSGYVVLLPRKLLRSNGGKLTDADPAWADGVEAQPSDEWNGTEQHEHLVELYGVSNTYLFGALLVGTVEGIELQIGSNTGMDP
ncbi:hypothetical protein BJ742DRAFT_744563 [Cladochytrium replicatum]|nr:hypothetical protein BJ742DRAFT_744563 [Cladochytrium replicatum]